MKETARGESKKRAECMAENRKHLLGSGFSNTISVL